MWLRKHEATSTSSTPRPWQSSRSSSSARSTLPGGAALDESGVSYELVPVAHDADPADVILEATDRDRTALLVIGTRRRTPVGKLIMAPTTQRLLLEAGCPVLCVKAGYDAA